jgi:hypothetical protein
VIEAALTIRVDVFLLVLLNIPYPKRFALQPLIQLLSCMLSLLLRNEIMQIPE